MNYLERYRQGEYQQVWQELQSLGAAVRQEKYLGLASEVAMETMQRVGRNCERIVKRLETTGYTFGVYPNGSRGYFSEGALRAPTDATRADCAELESLVGPLPLSIKAFWQHVGAVDLVGRLPGWPTGLDPLVIEPPEAALSELEAGGVVVREREGRRNRYQIDQSLPLRHSLEQHCTIGDILRLVNNRRAKTKA